MLRTLAGLLLVLAPLGSQTALSPAAQRWNKTFSAEEPGFNVRPNAFLVESVSALKPGRALDLGMGAGRNAVFLAKRGWDVTGVDISSVGIAKTKAAAEAAGVKVAAVNSTVENFDIGEAQWDLIVVIYWHGISAHAARIGKGLKPGGRLIVEGFHVDIMKSLPDRGASLGFKVNELVGAFRGLRITRYEDTIGYPDYSRDAGPLVRLIAVKQ